MVYVEYAYFVGSVSYTKYGRIILFYGNIMSAASDSIPFKISKACLSIDIHNSKVIDNERL